MKKIVFSTISGLLISATVASSGFAATSSFSDIENSYAKNEIIELQAKGILSGIDANSFDPKGELTRAQFVSMMVKALGLPVDENATSSFSDVKGWAVPYIEAANKAGIIHGIGNGKFDPSSVLTREQSAVILVLSLKTQGALDDTDAKLDFKDADKISSWAKSAVALALKYGLITGNPDGTFDPIGNASREMAAVMGANFIKTADVVKTQDPTPTPTTDPVITSVAVSNVHIASNNADPTKATVGDIVTLTFTTSEQVSNLSNFKINGSNPASFLSVASGSAWTNTATYVLDGTDPVGAMNFQINVENAVGLYSITTEATTDSSSVYVTDPTDTTAPGEIGSINETSNSPTAVTLTWSNPTDSDFDHVNIYRDGVLVGSSTNGSFTDTNISASTSYAYKFTTVDKNGNESVGTTVTPIISVSPETLLSNPTLTVFAPNLNQPWVNAGVTYAPNTVYQVNVNFASGTTLGVFQSAEFSVYDANGAVLETNKAKPALLDPALGYAGLSDLFVIGEAQDLVNDPNWEIGGYGGTATSTAAPAKVVFKLVDKTGAYHIVEATLSQSY